MLHHSKSHVCFYSMLMKHALELELFSLLVLDMVSTSLGLNHTLVFYGFAMDTPWSLQCLALGLEGLNYGDFHL